MTVLTPPMQSPQNGPAFTPEQRAEMAAMPFMMRISYMAHLQDQPSQDMSAPSEGGGMNGDQYKYKEGGLVGPGGKRVPLGAQQPQTQQMNPQEMVGQIQQFTQANPQVVAQVKQAVEQAIQSGELTMDELSKAVKLAQLAVSNPQMYPQLRQFAIQQGIATEQDIPQQYDQGLLFAILAVGAAMQNGQQPAAAATPAPSQPQVQAQPPNGGPPMSHGGLVPRSKNLDQSVPITAHEGEVVIPAHIVRAKGTEFFEKMIQSYDPNAPKK